jgi:hypothetical protein
MNKHKDKRQQLIDELMASEGEPANGALLQPWRHLGRQLSPLIGENGFCALFGRAGRLVAAHYGWLVAGSSFKTIDVLIAALGDSFDGIAADEARAGNIALLDTFTRLLADLIGEALTIRLLSAASQRQGDQKNAQEQKQ